MTAQRWTVLCIAATWLGMAGCATYVNVPAQVGDVAQNEPNLTTVSEVEAEAVRAVLADRPIEGTVTLELPPGTRPKSYDKVIEMVGEGVSAEKAEGRPVISVRQVRVRGWYAQADVVRPGSRKTDPPQLVTVSMRWDMFNKWQSQDVKLWRIPVEQALEQSRRDAEHEINPNAPDPNKEATKPY